MIAACEGSTQGICFWRQMIIEVFVHQRIGWVAIVFALAATFLRWQWLASLAVAASLVALLLYTPEPGAIGLLLGLMVLLRGRRLPIQHKAISTTVAANPSD